MATITINVKDDIEKEFRNILKLKYGEGKGILGKAIEEALKKWIFEQKQKDITARQIELMKKGLWKDNDYKFNRDEIYEKRRNLSC